MALQPPNLDDRSFQDLVDEAKRRIGQRCPEWSDHNVSDPGVTLIELFAGMIDQLLYRLNRVPERLQIVLMDLVGMQLVPASSARADVTFWLSAPQPTVVTIPIDTEVATARTPDQQPIAFRTMEELPVVPCAVAEIGRIVEGAVELRGSASEEEGFPCFQPVPRPGDALLVGLSEPVPRCAVNLRFVCERGSGVNPNDPPLVWEAWTGRAWRPCDVDSDGTGGLNQAGDVVLHVPPGHQRSFLGQVESAWLRCRVVPERPGQAGYDESPRVMSVRALTIGGTSPAVQADLVVRDELVGVSDGTYGQPPFPLVHRPVAAAPEDERVLLFADEDKKPWRRVRTFADSSRTDRHFLLDEVSGEVRLGVAVRLPNGGVRWHTAIPPKGARLRLSEYRVGGGSAGNVGAGALRYVKSSLPFVRACENRQAASGGADAETLEEARRRAPIELRSRTRAVTLADFAWLTREASPEVARTYAASGGDEGQDRGSVRVLLVPALRQDDDELGGLREESLVPSERVFRTVVHYLDQRRMVGVRVLVGRPAYVGFSIRARVRTQARTDEQAVLIAATRSLYNYYHPLRGGSGHNGWPFGRGVYPGDVYGVLQRTPGVDMVESVELFPTNPGTGAMGDPVPRLEIAPDQLPLSVRHEVARAGAP